MKYLNKMSNNILPNIKNWKLKEVIDSVNIVDENSSIFKESIIKKLNLPVSIEFIMSTISNTELDWNKISNYYKFYFDRAGWEKRIGDAFKISELKKSQHLIITYGWEEPTVMIPTELFFDDWEGFIASTHYESLIFSEDYKLIMEISRDYYLHSNFEILKE
jgi:hypothetical protein